MSFLPFSAPITIQCQFAQTQKESGKLDTIVTMGNSETYAFFADDYWKVTESFRVEPGYPRNTSDDWNGLPANLDASFTWTNGKTYFFKGKHFWEFDDERMEVTKSSPMASGEFWLHCPKELVGVDMGVGQPHVSSGPALATLHYSLLLSLLSIKTGTLFTRCIP